MNASLCSLILQTGKDKLIGRLEVDDLMSSDLNHSHKRRLIGYNKICASCFSKKDIASTWCVALDNKKEQEHNNLFFV